MLPVMILLAVGLLVDWYLNRRMAREGVSRMWRKIHQVVAAVASAALLIVAVAPKKAADDESLALLMWTLFAYMSLYLPKCLAAVIMLVQQGIGFITHRKLKGMGIAAAVVAVSVFILMWWGALINRFSIDVKEVEVDIPGLPASFDGYRIAQISDIHTGTYGNDTTFLKRVVDCVNGLNPDIIMFTGDIVNRHSAELEPFVNTLGQLKAKDGVLSVMGNHDYGDYYVWPSPEARLQDIENLQNMQARMGWRMLNNEHMTLRGNPGDSLVVIGVENIGDHPFPVYGSLSKAYPEISDKSVKVLMSHNPRHWVDSIAGREDVNVALTLAGHTHAMQIELFGLSPAVYRYKTWGGLYPDSLGRKLYVNIGMGEVGIPARIGATPEITLITLRSK